MKITNKGKVHPSPSSSAAASFFLFSSSSSHGDYLSVLKLLPVAILALLSVLSIEDREVLAYMITRSMKTTTTTTDTNKSSSSLIQDSKKKPSKKQATHKPPIFDCDCFECYTSYWFRWDSSPNRELIHHAIEAFDDHLANGEAQKSKKNNRAKRKDKSGRRVAEKPVSAPGQTETPLTDAPFTVPETTEDPLAANGLVVRENDVSPGGSLEKLVDACVEAHEVKEVAMVAGDSTEEKAVVVLVSAASNHKGLARKVLPDVLGLFNSRLWSLWSPNV